MKPALIALLALGFCVVGCGKTSWVSDPSDPNNVTIEVAIREVLARPTGELTKADLEGVWRLSLNNNKLTDVKGLEKLTQLKELNLSGNQLTDVKDLEKLTQLTELNLQNNPDLTKAQIAELQKALPKCQIRLLGGTSCLLPGTKISMADGSSRNIEDIKAGDKVMAYNEAQGTIEEAEVAQTFVHSATRGYLTVNNKLRVTGNHPIYVMGRGWIRADELVVGDRLLHEDGADMLVEKIDVSRELVTTYNIEVKEHHNYFAEGYLVHNKLPPENPTREFQMNKRVAESGDANAQNRLGRIYAGGFGVEQDYVTAYAWAIIAAANGDKNAPKFKSEILEKKMTPEQIAKAEALAKEMVKKNPKLLKK